MSEKIENLKQRLLDLEAPSEAADWQLKTLNPLTNDVLDALDRIKSGAFEALPYFLNLQAKAIAEAELEIIRTLVIDTLIHGHSISIGDVSCSKSRHEIMRVIANWANFPGATNEPCLYIHSEKGAQIGWVQIKFGSQGWDVMSDHCKRIEPLMAGAQALSDEYAKKFLMET